MTDGRNQEPIQDDGKLSRRDFMQAVAAGGAGMMLSTAAFAQVPVIPTPTPAILASQSAADPINVGIIGFGFQGQNLASSTRNMTGIRFKAVCDIWPYRRMVAQRIFKAAVFKHSDVNVYEDYREMLAKEKGLDAVIVATPDWMHAEHAIATLEAGLHVYCEKPLANTLEDARRIVLAQRKSGKIVQVGQQRRSNSHYLYALSKILKETGMLGRVGQVNAQWNRSKDASQDLGWARSVEISPEVLRRFGYASMHELVNWRWLKKFGGGSLLDLGIHQLDVINWFLGAKPKAVVASGGVDNSKTRECCDTVMCLLEYETARGPVRGFYQVLSSTSQGSYLESFLGDEGTLVMSERPDITRVFREEAAPEWTAWEKAGVIQKISGIKQLESGIPGVVMNATSSLARDLSYSLPVQMRGFQHQPHLENFFDAIRNGNAVNCPAEFGYEALATVAGVNRSLETGAKVVFREADFVV